jgi:signal transduction histidine kinase/integral membrane sensor domain MASE1
MTFYRPGLQFRLVLDNACLAVVYYLAAKLFLSLATVHPSAASLWPPTGIATAALLVFGYRLWPGAFVAALLANATTYGSLATSLAIAGGNTLEAIAAAALIRRFADGCAAFDRPQTVFRYAVFAGLVATLLSPTVGVTALWAAGYAARTDYNVMWTTWWLGDVGGNLVIAPVLILWLARPWPEWRAKPSPESLLLVLLFVAQGALVFTGVGAEPATSHPAVLLALPLVVWIAFRYGQRATATAHLLVSIAALTATLKGYGPLALQSENESLLTLQVVMAVMGVMMMAVAASVSEHVRSKAEIRRLNGELEARVLDRTCELYESNAMLKDANEKLIVESLERARAENQMRHALTNLQALRAVETAVASSLDLQTILDVLLEKVEQYFPYPTTTTVRLLNAETGELEPLACRNIDKERWIKNALKGHMPFARSVIECGTPQVVRNMHTDERTRRSSFYLHRGIKSAAKFPLIVSGEVVGILTVYTQHEHDFTADEIDFLGSICGQAAIAIRHSQLYARVKRQTEELTLVNKAKTQFLSVMSHELRTPLNVIMGYSSLLKLKTYGEVNAKQDEILEKVLLNANQQLALIDRILQVAQIAAGATQVYIQPVDLEGFFAELRAACETAATRGVVVHWPHAPLPVVETDGEKLKHIVGNLVDNAVKFTEEGEITVTAAYDPGRDALTVQVADTGEGIKANEVPHLFEMFTQLDSSEKRLHGGAGVGLYIVKNLTDRLNGTIEVTTEPGRGSTFSVTIPAKEKRKRLSA